MVNTHQIRTLRVAVPEMGDMALRDALHLTNIQEDGSSQWMTIADFIEDAEMMEGK